MYETANPQNKSIRNIVIVVIVVIVLVTGGWYLLKYKPEQQAIEKARLEQQAKEEAEQKRKALAAQKQAKYTQLIKEADAAFVQEQWERAQSLYSQASGLFPDQAYPLDQLTLVNAKLDQLAALAAKRAAGIIEMVSSPTGRYYIIVSSSIDEDLAKDYAEKLANDGNNVKIIVIDAVKQLYYCVAVADYSTRKEAEDARPSFSSYQKGIVIQKY